MNGNSVYNANKAPQNWTENYGNTEQGYKNFQNNVNNFNTIDGPKGNANDKSDRVSPGGQVFSWDKDANHGDGAWMQRGQVKPDSISKLNKGQEITDDDIQEFTSKEQDKNYGGDFYEDPKAGLKAAQSKTAGTDPIKKNYYEDDSKNWSDNYGNTEQGYGNYQNNIYSFKPANPNEAYSGNGYDERDRVSPSGQIFGHEYKAGDPGGWSEKGHVKNESIYKLQTGEALTSDDIELYSPEELRRKNPAPGASHDSNHI